MIDAGGAGVGFGFLGGIVGGFLAGYVIVDLEKLLAGLPKNLDGLTIPVSLSTTVVAWLCSASLVQWRQSTPA